MYPFQETMSSPTNEIKASAKLPSMNAVSLFGHATHSGAVRSFP
jgi:hypothetical protein